MTDEAVDHAAETPSGPGLSARIGIGLSVAFLVATLAGGIWTVFQFAAHERARETQLWQTRLGIIADTRAGAVSAWLRRQTEELAGLADNAALQLYMTQLAARPSAGVSPAQRRDDDLARGDYLSNLLDVVAHRAGFHARPDGPEVNANIRRVGVAGIALVTLDGRVVAASPDAPPLEGDLAAFIAGATRGGQAVRDLYLDHTGVPAMAFAVPLYRVQGSAPADQIGWVFGVKQVAGELFPLLRQPGAVWETAEAVLVRRNGNTIDYLSPTARDVAPLTRGLAADTPGLAARFALESPGGFAIRRDYRGKDVLATGRSVPPLSWAVLYKIDRVEALGPTEGRTRRIAAILVLAVIAVGVGIFAVWRHGTSVRSARTAARQAALADRYAAQSRFLKLVTDTQPGPMTIVDGDSRYLFANRVAADRAGIGERDILGKTMADVLGPAAAAPYQALNREVLADGVARRAVHRSGTNGDLRIVQAEHVAVSEMPNGASGVMIVEEDITAAVSERERRARTLDQVIATLIAILDRRDPYAAHHSERVSQTAAAIAAEMGLAPLVAETAAMAGRLLNVGKITVPQDILTRDQALDEDQILMVRDSIGSSADLVASIEFDGPVLATLREIQRLIRGSDETPAATDDVALAAQIVLVANAFVAMISDRAWRRGLDGAEAAGRLCDDADGRFERRVTSALLNLVDNRGLSLKVAPAGADGAAQH